jgi:hypothetical protein
MIHTAVHDFQSVYAVFCYLAGTVGFVAICIWAYFSQHEE